MGACWFACFAHHLLAPFPRSPITAPAGQVVTVESALAGLAPATGHLVVVAAPVRLVLHLFAVAATSSLSSLMPLHFRALQILSQNLNQLPAAQKVLAAAANSAALPFVSFDGSSDLASRFARVLFLFFLSPSFLPFLLPYNLLLV